MSKIRSFRGLITDGGIDTISLHTNTGKIGYRIKSFRLIGNQPGVDRQESTVKIFSIPQTVATSTIDFSDNTLLAAGFASADNSGQFYPINEIVIFDNVKFNQDIYITHVESANSFPVNYYIELEPETLSLDENTVATLKDIRNISRIPTT